MPAKGRIMGDELMQLQELGVGNVEQFAGLSAAQGIPLIIAQLRQQFGGLAAEEARTFGGRPSPPPTSLPSP
jgi:hypothetical protein